MRNTFVIITEGPQLTPRGKKDYLIGIKFSAEELIEYRQQGDNLGFSLIRCYRAPYCDVQKVKGVTDACYEFTEGELDLDSLDVKVKEILGESQGGEEQ